MSAILSITNLQTHFFLRDGVVRAVDGVTLQVPRGKTLGIVGESGCGKSQTAYSILRLITTPGKIVGGEVRYHGERGDVVISSLPEDGPELRGLRGKEIAMIFQEPMSSFSPVHTIGDQIQEAVELHTPMRGAAAREHTVKMLARVGIPNPERRYAQYPHELSGGMRQRAMIAMALSCNPRVLLADEPTTALDVTIQAQILALMRSLQDEFGMSIVMITHNLGVVAEMCHEVAVMYLGRVVEQGPVEAVFAEPLHPYTQALLRSIPGLHGRRKEALATIRGTIRDPLTRLAGCPFHPRCDHATDGRCRQGAPPPLTELRPGHQAACWVQQEAIAHGKS